MISMISDDAHTPITFIFRLHFLEQQICNWVCSMYGWISMFQICRVHYIYCLSSLTSISWHQRLYLNKLELSNTSNKELELKVGFKGSLTSPFNMFHTSNFEDHFVLLFPICRQENTNPQLSLLNAVKFHYGTLPYVVWPRSSTILLLDAPLSFAPSSLIPTRDGV